MTFQVRLRQKGDNAAAAFAIERHGAQDHGCLKITDHLADVAWNARMHYDPHVNILEPEQIIAAAWLHDVLEDTPTTLEEIEDKFGYQVANVVNLLTDKDGRNRLERHLRTYHAIRRDPDAILIKLSDRRHNHERSIKYGEKYAIMYRDEYLRFKFALYNPGQFVELWRELDDQYKQLEDLLTW
jgi:(p)ppGpp synthase/HD superfamily hydrolase